ncbi:MAG: hypothetical protein Q7I99_06075 [Acholeplasmataceae bacterium]|nr:hypothetical protein [Acholeplasmataceae bacterium]
MVTGKFLVGCAKGVGKFLNSKLGKKAIATGALIGVGLAGNGVIQNVSAKKKNKRANAIQEKALSKHDSKLSETNNIIANLAVEEKKSIEMIDLFLKLTEKIDKRPTMSEIDSKIKLPSLTPVEVKRMSNGLDMALAGISGGGTGALAGLVFCGASLSTFGFAALGSGVVLSIKGSKLSKQAVKNVEHAKKLSNEVDSIVEYYKQIDRASIKLTNAIEKVNDVYIEKLDNLERLVEINKDYKKYSENEVTLVKNVFKLTMLLVKMCKTKIAKRLKETELINIEEIELIVENANKICNETKIRIFDKVLPYAR